MPLVMLRLTSIMAAPADSISSAQTQRIDEELGSDRFYSRHGVQPIFGFSSNYLNPSIIG
jgi:hypothetical protein